MIGCLYAARLRQAGHDVMILARGQRLADLRARGLVLVHADTGARLAATVEIAEALAPDVPDPGGDVHAAGAS